MAGVDIQEAQKIQTCPKLLPYVSLPSFEWGRPLLILRTQLNAGSPQESHVWNMFRYIIRFSYPTVHRRGPSEALPTSCRLSFLLIILCDCWVVSCSCRMECWFCAGTIQKCPEYSCAPIIGQYDLRKVLKYLNNLAYPNGACRGMVYTCAFK